MFNRDSLFTLDEIAGRTKLSKETARHEATELLDAELLRKKGERAAARYQVNPRFEHLTALDTFIRETTSVVRRERSLGSSSVLGHFDLSHSQGISLVSWSRKSTCLSWGILLMKEPFLTPYILLRLNSGGRFGTRRLQLLTSAIGSGCMTVFYGTFSIIHTVSSSTKSGCKDATLCAGARILAT